MRLRLRLLLTLVMLAAPARGLAQTAAAQAQVLFETGRSLLESGRIAEACEAFASSQKLDPAITTLLNLANCQKKNHQLATAWGNFVDANRMARERGDDKLASVASKHADSLKPRLSQLTVSVAAERSVPGLQIWRDRELVDPATWNYALPIDGGTYTFSARAPGYQPSFTTIVVAAEADTKTFELPELLVLPQRQAVKKAVVKPPPRRRSSVLAPVLVGVGALGLGGGAGVFKYLGDKLYDDAAAATTQDRRTSLENSANDRRHVAIGLGAGAIVFAGVAVYLYVRGRPRPSASALLPLAAPGLAGLAITRAW